jgi:hypothetical protein
LLVDILTPNVGTPLPLMDAVNQIDGVNRAYIDNVGSPRAGQDSLGLVTQFQFTPEPSTLLLLSVGAISLLGYRKAKSHG